MSYRHEAIFTLYPNAVEIFDGGIKDADGNLITIDESSVTTKQTELENAEPLRLLRKERNAKLAETDWTQSRDVTLTNDAAWATYRQALRDITDTYSDLDSVVWPTKPE